jgi:threonine dehydrogenase-like Zn-dependent dehydrogenase
MQKAFAAVLIGPRTFEQREFPLPEIGPDDGLLRVEANGLCGTDYDQFLCDLHLGPFGGPPIVPGHEMIGWIEKIGREAAKNWKLREGDRVCVKTPLPCGRCRQCRMAAFHRCERHMGYGLFLKTTVAPSLWGGYATHMYLHPDSMMKLAPEQIPTDVMTLFNPLSGVVRWIYEIPNLRIAEHVVILGPGQRGILAALTAKQAGAKTVTVSGLAQDRHRLEVAKRLGADAVVDVSTEDLVTRVREVTHGEMADLVLDMSAGSTEPVVQAVEVARPGGRIVLAGLKSGKPMSGLVTDKIVIKELQIFGAYSSTMCSLEIAIEILKQRHSELAVMCSHVYPLEKADTAVRALGREIDDGREVVHVNFNMTGTV